MRRFMSSALISFLTLCGAAHAQIPVDTGWTYQGKLTNGGTPATGAYDLRFSLFLDDQGTIPTGPVLDVPGVAVNAGLFSTRLDFGAQFTGYKNWLQIEVSPAGAGTYTALPLQEVTSAPQSLFSMLPWATDTANNIIYTGGMVGIGRSPEFGLDVSTANAIRLGLDGNGGGQLVLANNANDNRIFMEAYDAAGTGSASELLLTGWHGQNMPKLTFNASVTSWPTGLVGVGTTAPGAKLHVYDPSSVTSLVETGGGTNSWARTMYKNLSGSWEIGTSRGFNGDSFYIYRTGAATIALSVLPTGVTQVRTLQILGGSDLAEPFDVAAAGDAEAQPGMVVVIDENRPGELRLADQPYDGKVAGVISGANGLAPGMVMSAEGQKHAEGKHPVAMTGRVWVYVDASLGTVKPGDLLTSSSTPGHAMVASDYGRAFGAVIGKAMTELKDGKGLVLVLVNLQ